MAAERCDCVIVGGGLVGATLALALAPLGLRVVLVEAHEPAAPAQPAFDDRGLALSLASVNIFRALGVWPAMAAEAAPIRRVHVSERGRFGKLRLEAASIGQAALGYVITARAIGAALSARVADADVVLLCPAAVTGVQAGDAGVRVFLSRGGEPVELAARLVIGADGGESAVRDQLGIVASTRSYDQHAIVTNVEPSRPHEGTAYERFTPGGPCALLPMSGGRCGLVLTATALELPGFMSLDDAAFLALANARYGGFLGELTRVGARRAWPLRLTRVEARHAQRAVLVGNAAHVIHPNAAQGMNLGLRDAATLAELVAGAVRAGDDPGGAALLAAYSARREADEARTVAFSDGLARVFYNRRQPLASLRHWGLAAIDRVPAAKRHFLRLGTGLAGRPPLLALGQGPA